MMQQNIAQRQRPTVSVVIPNRNHAHLISRALQSLEQQTLGATEIIVIDDASTDDSLAVLETWKAKLPALKIVSLQQHKGVIGALNEGLNRATGDLIYAGASDDVARPALFETAVRAFDRHPEAGVFCAEALVIDDGEGYGTRPAVGPIFERYFTPAGFRDWLSGSDNLCIGVATLARREHMVALGGYDEALGPFCDSFLIRRICLRHGIVFAPQVLGEWHRSSTGFSSKLARDVDETKRFIEAARSRIEADGEALFPPGYGDLFVRRATFNAAHLALPDVELSARIANLPNDWMTRLASLPGLHRLGPVMVLTLAFRPLSLPRLLAARLSQMWRNARDGSRLKPILPSH